MMDKKLGYLHFWLTFASVYLVFFPMHFMGIDGVPRRYYSFTTFAEFSNWVDLNSFISVAAIIGFGSQLIFVYNFFKSMRGGEKTTQNPWKANTLEWTTKVNPGHGNWEGPIPAVHRWPYDYSKPEVELDYVPMTISEEDLANGVDYDKEGYDPMSHQSHEEENETIAEESQEEHHNA